MKKMVVLLVFVLLLGSTFVAAGFFDKITGAFGFSSFFGRSKPRIEPQQVQPSTIAAACGSCDNEGWITIEGRLPNMEGYWQKGCKCKSKGENIFQITEITNDYVKVKVWKGNIPSLRPYLVNVGSSISVGDYKFTLYETALERSGENQRLNRARIQIIGEPAIQLGGASPAASLSLDKCRVCGNDVSGDAICKNKCHKKCIFAIAGNGRMYPCNANIEGDKTFNAALCC